MRPLCPSLIAAAQPAQLGLLHLDHRMRAEHRRVQLLDHVPVHQEPAAFDDLG